MNCEDFNNIINEVADYKPLDATIRNAGVSHVALCADCAAKLTNARAVSSSLLLAVGAESEDAPARVKENLLAAFAAERQTKQQPQRVIPFSPRRKLGWWTAAAVAAAAAIAFAVILPSLRNEAGPDRPTQVAVVEPPVPTPTVAPIAIDKPGPGADEPSNPPKRFSSKPIGSRKKIHRLPAANMSETVARNTTSEYVPLTYLATATAIDTGTIVRVQLSRAALVRLGLPVNEGTNDSVNAEVVLGDDGVARAIRLIQ